MIGITDHAQKALGDIVFVELPKPGATLTQGKSLGTVESVKAVSDIYAPASGTVTEVNQELATAPEKINADPHGAWMVKVKLTQSVRRWRSCFRPPITRSSSPRKRGTRRRACAMEITADL